jgi:hypothetical protein
MRGGYPISAVTIEQHSTNIKTGSTKIRVWCEAQSSSPYKSRVFTSCGHKHKTLEAAQKCVPAVEAAYREKRWPKRIA